MIKYKSCRSLCVKDDIFDDVRSNYSDFDQWFKKCVDLDRTMVTVDDDSAIAILKYKANAIKICTFVVRGNHRQQGLGGTLIAELLDHMVKMGKEELYVSVRNTNERFINFCKNNGFSQCSDDGNNIVFSRKA